jgi:hypothetical protein
MFRSPNTPSSSASPDFPPLCLASVDSVPSALKSPCARLTHAALASGLCKSPHQFHSMVLTLPLFSCSYALFCTAQSSNSFSFNSFRTLCTQHPGWAYASTARPLPSFSTALTPRAHRNTRNSNPLMRLLHGSLDALGWGSAPGLLASVSPMRRASSCAARHWRFADHGTRVTGHGPRLPRLLQLFDLQLSTSSSTIPALHSGGPDFTLGAHFSSGDK